MRVVEQMRPDTGILTYEARQFGLVRRRAVARVEDAEVSHLQGFLKELGSMLSIRRAEEVFFLKPEGFCQNIHDSGRKTAHSEAFKLSEYIDSFFCFKLLQDEVIVQHLPEADAAFEVVAEHVRHTENGVEACVRRRQRLVGADGGEPFHCALEARVEERIVHLAGVEVHFDDGVVEESDLALLPQHSGHMPVLAQRPQCVLVRAGDPDVDVAALAARRLWVERGQRRALKEARVQPAVLEDGLQLLDVPGVGPMDGSNHIGQSFPLLIEVAGRHLLRRQPSDALPEYAHHGLNLGHAEHISPLRRAQR